MRFRQALIVVGFWVACAPACLVAAPDYWDSRLTEICGLKLTDVSATVATGQGYWRLIRAEFQDEQEANGTHHIYYKALDINGNPIENQKTWASWPYDSEANTVSQLSKGAVDGYWANFGMSGTNYTPCNWPFNAWIDSYSSPRGYAGLSDKVSGMGMTNPRGTAAHAHVSFILTWRWTIKANTTPTITRLPAAFNPVVNSGQTLRNDSFTVSNSGAGTLNYSITDNAGWLDVSPSTGTSTGSANTHQISYSLAGLAAGNYSATITIADSTANNSPQTISVNLTVNTPLLPHLNLSPSSVSVRAFRTQTLPDDHFSVSNSAAGTLSYSIADDAPWLSVHPVTGTSSGDASSHSLIYSLDNLPAGTYIANISVVSSDADNSPQTLVVALVLDRLPGDVDDDLDVDQTDFGFLQACLTGPNEQQTDGNCLWARFDGDLDVDRDDLDLFLACMKGPAVTADPACIH